MVHHPADLVIMQLMTPKTKSSTLVSNRTKLGEDGHGQRKEMYGEGEKWDRFKKIAVPILATAAAVGAAYAGHRAYQNNNRVVTYKGYNPDSHWTPGSYRELTQSEPSSLARIPRQLPIPPNAPLGSTSASVTRDWARGVRYPPVAPPVPQPLMPAAQYTGRVVRYIPPSPALPKPLTVTPYTRELTRQPRIDLKALIRANKTGDVSKLTKHQLERYNFHNRELPF